MSFDHTKAPFPWFGGKSQAASAVWRALGDVPHYVEPFAGSLAVLLGRPHEANRPYFSETVNDIDCHIANVWRSLRLSPDATAEAASWIVSEVDLLARHIRMVEWREEGRIRLAGDPDWHDPKIAGWWLWGVACWIGGEWCAGVGPWHSKDGRLVKQAPKRKGREPGVDSRRPHLSDDGRGVNAPQLREPGVEDDSIPHPDVMPGLRRWFALLSARLRHVRVINGDWKRVVTTGATLTLPVRQGHGPCGVFLDPPYADTAGRDKGLYAHDSQAVAHDVREWCLAHGDDPRYRIVLACFEGEHGSALETAGWRAVEWFAKGHLRGGMGNTAARDEDDEDDSPTHQQHRERLWLSPHCVGIERDLFSSVEEEEEDS